MIVDYFTEKGKGYNKNTIYPVIKEKQLSADTQTACVVCLPKQFVVGYESKAFIRAGKKGRYVSR